MKNIFTIAFFCIASSLMAQIPNGSFESWTSGDPDNWVTSNNNSASVINIFQSTNAHAGNSAVRLETWTYQNYWFGGVMGCPSVGNFFPVNAGQAGALNGWYVSNFVGGDKLTITTVLEQGGTTIAGGSIDIINNTSIYQQFSIPYVYSPTIAVPDSGAIGMAEYTSTGAAIGLHSGTYVIIDDLTFGPPITNGINDAAGKATLEKIYPNPSNEISWVEYSITEKAPVKISIYDMNGNLVLAPVDQQQQPGRYRVAVETMHLSAGLYLVCLQSGMNSSTMKLHVAPR
jgi:hypothetical protein